MRRTLGMKVVVAAVLAVNLTSTPAEAGNTCRKHQTTVEEFKSALNSAARIQNRLDKANVETALLARVGRDISGYGLKYTHIGFVRRRSDTGAWQVIHQLNPCGTGTSILRVHGLANFMLDDLYRHDVRVVFVGGSLSAALKETLESGFPARIHDKRYSMISYAGLPVRYQNSNQWALEIIAEAQAKRAGRSLTSRRQTHAHYLGNGFRGTPIYISGIRRTFASLGSKNLRFDDHPEQNRKRGVYEVVSVRSIVHYLEQAGDLVSTEELDSTYVRKQQPSDEPEAQEN